MGGARRVVDRQRSTARPPADAADRGPDALAEVPIADPSLLLSVVAPRPTDAATVDGAAATIPGSTAIPAVTGIIDLPVDGAGAVTVTPDGRQAWITHPDRG
jgi:hypothetical protein